jgi:hypothetical protein
MPFLKYILISFMIFSLTLHAYSDRGLQLKKMKEEQRVALVIGNAYYKHLSILTNPLNDARLMRSVLQKRGFEVLYKENATKKDMKKLVKKFTHKLSRGGVGLYYFAGHGVNVSGQNYLIGTDSLMDDEEEVEYETLALNYITKKMQSAGNRLNIIILDACRNNPFHRGGGGGLAPISNARGMFIAYATEAGKVASDGGSIKNGVFTHYLVKNLKVKGAKLYEVFKSTRADVYKKTNGKQSPGVYDQTIGNFFFTLPSTIHPSKINTDKSSTFSFDNKVKKELSLTVRPTPSDARVSITNIKPRYYHGIKLKKGFYKIKVSKSGYLTQTREINLTSDLVMNVTLKKQVNKFSLTITTTPSDARVQIQNIKSKYYDAIKLRKGNYKIRVSKKGYVPKTKIVNLTHDRKLIIKLVKEIDTKKQTEESNYLNNGTVNLIGLTIFAFILIMTLLDNPFHGTSRYVIIAVILTIESYFSYNLYNIFIR